MPDRGDNLTPIISLGFPLGDVAPQRLGGADPEHLHGEECSRPQQGERREALPAAFLACPASQHAQASPSLLSTSAKSFRDLAKGLDSRLPLVAVPHALHSEAGAV